MNSHLVYEHEASGITIVKHLIITTSKFDDFKTLTFWGSLIVAVSQCNAFKVIPDRGNSLRNE